MYCLPFKKGISLRVLHRLYNNKPRNKIYKKKRGKSVSRTSTGVAFPERFGCQVACRVRVASHSSIRATEGTVYAEAKATK